MTAIALENSLLKAEFDPKTGALIGLESKMTGWRIQNRPQLGLSFRLHLPLPDRRSNYVLGSEQKLESWVRSEDGNRIVFTWKNLRSQHCDPVDICLKATVTLDDKGLTFDAEIENSSELVVEALTYPCLGDIPMPAPDESLSRLDCHCSMDKTPLLPEFVNEKGYWGSDNPIQVASSPFRQFVLVASEKQGLYAGCHDERVRTLVQFIFELKPGYENSLALSAPDGGEIGGKPVHLEFSVAQLPFLSPGERWSMSPVVLKPYVGTWHKGVDVYKAWVATWLKHADAPAWTRDVHSWQQIHINSPEDELRCRYTDLLKYGEDCAKHGVKAIQLVGWNHGGQDRGNPSHDTDPRLGTAEELREAIAKIHEMGVKVVLFNKYTWVDLSTDWYKKELHKYVARDPYLVPYHSHGYEYQTPAQFSGMNVREFNSMCHLSAKWREIACREFEKNFHYGAAGMLYDECFHHGRAIYCFDPDHGHRVPEYIYSADETLAEDFRKVANEKDPDFLFSGEALFQRQWRHYSLCYFRIHKGHIAAPRYIDPYCNIMVAVQGFDDREKINLCLLYRYIMSYEPYNFKGRLDDFPLTIEYGKKVDALRKRYSQYLWDGECRDIIGASVTVDGKPHSPYSVFVQPKSGKRAVAIANQERTSQIEVAIEIEGPSTRLLLATPEDPETREANGTVTIPPRSLAVLMEP